MYILYFEGEVGSMISEAHYDKGVEHQTLLSVLLIGTREREH